MMWILSWSVGMTSCLKVLQGRGGLTSLMTPQRQLGIRILRGTTTSKSSRLEMVSLV